MTNTDSTPPATQITSESVSGDQSAHPLESPILPFVTTTSNDVRPSTARTSFTQVDHGNDEQPTSSSAPVPTPRDIASDNNVTHQPSELISTLSQAQQQSIQQQSVQQQSIQQPPTPSTQPQAMSETVPQMPQTYLTFLLISGRRRTMSFEPESAIGRVKELVWNSWPTEWQDERPPAPSYMRLLYLGKMLQDDETLSGLKLPTHTTQSPTSPGPSSPGPFVTIMHLSIRPYAPLNEGDGLKKKKKRGNNGDTNGQNEPGNDNNCCQCVIC